MPHALAPGAPSRKSRLSNLHRSAWLAWPLLVALVAAACSPDGGPDPATAPTAGTSGAGAEANEPAGGRVGTGGGDGYPDGAGDASTGGSEAQADGGHSSAGGTESDGGSRSPASGGGPASGGTPGAGGRAGGANGSSGADGSGSADGSGGTSGAGGALDPVAPFTLVIDVPADRSEVSGVVTVTGRAPGFQNVEIWDATHAHPPLAQATPDSSGAFATTVDASVLEAGATTWTVHAWDSAPGQSFDHTTSVTLNLTIGNSNSSGDPCAGQTCSGLGQCVARNGQASCDCNAGHHAVGLTCVPDSSGEGTTDPGTAYVPAGYHLVFSDEFSGSALDTSKWNTLAPFGVQWYADSNQKQAFVAEAVSLQDGVVRFTASRSNGNANANGQPYVSGSITTNGTFSHGYFEARVKVPAGKGFWPAYWVTSSTRWPPEWDIFEIIDDVIFGYTHPVSGGVCRFVEGVAGADSTYTLPNLYGSYHVYGFHWTATDLYWYVDGVMTEHYAVDAAAGANDPFWLNLSLQVGGDWPGDPDGTTPLPGYMDVDYVRIYQQ